MRLRGRISRAQLHFRHAVGKLYQYTKLYPLCRPDRAVFIILCLQSRARAYIMFLLTLRSKRDRRVFVSACLDLSCFYQPRAARFAARLGLAGHARRAGRIGVLHGHRVHGDLRRDDCLESALRPPHAPARHAHRDRCECVSDGRRTVRLFDLDALLDAHRLRRALRAGCGRHRRGAEQLRRAALQGQAHELAALLLGRGHDRQPVYHGLRADAQHVECGLPHRRSDPACNRRSAARNAAGLEGPCRRHRGGRPSACVRR